MPTAIIPIISLFSGAGGLDWGFRQEQFLPSLAIDSSQVAVDTYNLNHPGAVACRADLLKISATELIDLVEASSGEAHVRGVIGGPPCQPFSRGNVHRKPDVRRELPHRYAQLLGALNQRYSLDFFVFENVKGLSFEAHREYFSTLLELFRQAGFEVAAKELNAEHFGVAQIRHRIFIVGLSKQKYPGVQFEFPLGNPNCSLTVQDKISGLPEPVYFRRGLKPEEIPFHPNHWTMRPISSKFQGDGPATSKSVRSFFRLVWNEPSRTVAYGHREIHVHPDGHRRLSILEAMLLQGFPREYRLLGNLSQQVDLVSDAVPPPLAAALAQRVRQVIGME
jgi:DNA (cytosine-5)-methyltransferase 1